MQYKHHSSLDAEKTDKQAKDLYGFAAEFERVSTDAEKLDVARRMVESYQFKNKQQLFLNPDSPKSIYKMSRDQLQLFVWSHVNNFHNPLVK